MKKHKPYCERDHSASKRAKSLRNEMARQLFGKPTNVGDPNDKSATVAKAKRDNRDR